MHAWHRGWGLTVASSAIINPANVTRPMQPRTCANFSLRLSHTDGFKVFLMVLLTFCPAFAAFLNVIMWSISVILVSIVVDDSSILAIVAASYLLSDSLRSFLSNHCTTLFASMVVWVRSIGIYPAIMVRSLDAKEGSLNADCIKNGMLKPKAAIKNNFFDIVIIKVSVI